MRNIVAKRIRKSNACLNSAGKWVPSLYRVAKRVYKSNTQHPKFKLSKRQKRLQDAAKGA